LAWPLEVVGWSAERMPGICRWQLGVARAAISSGSRPAAWIEVWKLAALHRLLEEQDPPAAARCRSPMLELVTDMARALHAGLPGCSAYRDVREEARWATVLYDEVLRIAPRSRLRHDRARLLHWIARREPTPARWQRAARAYLDTLLHRPFDGRAGEALLGAIECWLRVDPR